MEQKAPIDEGMEMHDIVAVGLGCEPQYHARGKTAWLATPQAEIAHPAGVIDGLRNDGRVCAFNRDICPDLLSGQMTCQLLKIQAFAGEIRSEVAEDVKYVEGTGRSITHGWRWFRSLAEPFLPSGLTVDRMLTSRRHNANDTLTISI